MLEAGIEAWLDKSTTLVLLNGLDEVSDLEVDKEREVLRKTE